MLQITLFFVLYYQLRTFNLRSVIAALCAPPLLPQLPFAAHLPLVFKIGRFLKALAMKFKFHT